MRDATVKSEEVTSIDDTATKIRMLSFLLQRLRHTLSVEAERVR